MHLDQDRVPTCLEEALELLASGLNTTEKNAWSDMPALFMLDLWHGLAEQLRRAWSLHDPDTPLRIFFRKLGLKDAKEVSLFLIDSYWRVHHDQSVVMEQMVQEYLEES